MSTRKTSRPRPSKRDFRALDSSPAPAAEEGTPVTLCVAGKPVSTNQTYRTGRGGRWFKDDDAKAWQNAVLLEARRAMAGRPPFSGDVEVWIRFWFDSRKPDVDGPVKGLLDRLAPSIIANDRQVVAYHVTKFLDRENPRTEVEVRAWPAVVERVMDEAEVSRVFRVDEMGDGT